jgi:hypothetical protein
MRIMFIKWLKRKQKLELKPESKSVSEPERRSRAITSMMVPEPGAIIGGKPVRRSEPRPEPASAPIRSMMVPEPGAIIGGKRRRK